ncbi:purine-nucleoside phosphorylase [Pirellulales bacterium]|nr:purine-nucleoside phosphorylase [Pirellulales bacterium]
MLNLAPQMEASAAAVQRAGGPPPEVGLILGSGLGGLSDQIESPITIPYSDIPHFPSETTVIGHRGQLIVGTLGGKPVAAFQGRFHLYEGHSAATAALPVRLLQTLGASTLIVTNAAGGLNPQFAVGDAMLIDDQINLMFANPLIGVNDDALGPRFPDMSAPYDVQLQESALREARADNWRLHRGVYVSVLGPNYETRAEIRMLRQLGADAVGMSTVPEVIAARHAEMRVLGLSLITNIASPDAAVETSGHAVVETAATSGEKLRRLISRVVETF